jgi:RNA polymerase sigma factor (sigma-70 family)
VQPPLCQAQPRALASARARRLTFGDSKRWSKIPSTIGIFRYDRWNKPRRGQVFVFDAIRVDRTGDRDKFATVVVPHLAAAYSLARWLVGNRSDAEDVVQEASLRAFRSLETFNDGSARAWVLAIVRNTAFTWSSKNRRTTLVAIDDLGVDDKAEVELSGGVHGERVPTPEHAMIAQAETDDLERAIAALSPQIREVVVLRDLQGLSYREIAAVVAVPVGTVMSRLARGRQQLIRALTAGPD